MGLETSQAILLDVMPLHEQDRIAVFLTPERGKVRGVARGARRKYSRFAGQLAPLAKVNLTWFEKPGAELVRISSVDLVRTADRLQQDLEGILLGAYLADHLLEFAQENEDCVLLYRLLDSTIEALLEGVDRPLAARYFESWVLRLSGIFPSPWECPDCGREMERGVLSQGGDGLMCSDCGAGAPGGLSVSAAAIGFLREISGTKLRAMGESPPPESVLEEVEEVCGRVRRAFLQRELKSLRVMRETLAGLPNG